MKLHTLLIIGFAMSIAGCAKEEQAVPEEVDEAQTATPATEALPVENKEWQSDAFMKHMHLHAEKLDDLNFSLADGNFDAAMTPAYWMSRHETVGGAPSEMQPYLIGMREAARDVEEATDIAAAQLGAERINEQCQGCHAAAGITIE